MSTLSTKERILNTTEQLIADKGFSGISIRKISHAAQTNLAAINYHFGNKQQLINAVLERRLNNLFDIRQKMLNDLNQGKKKACVLEQVLHAFIAPALYMINDKNQGGKTFMLVLARAYAEQGEYLHQLMTTRYTNTIKKFADAIHRSVPHLDKETVFWRFHFIIGSLTYAMSDFGASSISKQMSESDYFNRSVDELIQFAVQALQA